MEKVHDYRYRVQTGEEITIRVTPMNLGPSLPSVKEQNGIAIEMENVGTDDALGWRKFCNKQPVNETHLVIVEVTFQVDSKRLTPCIDWPFHGGMTCRICSCGFRVPIKTDEDLSPDTINFRVKSSG